MKPFNKITIVGVGLLGGSIGLAIKEMGLAREVVGVFRDEKKITAAIKAGAIDRGTCDLKRAVSESDLVLLCSPVNDIIKKLKLINGWGGKNVLITDIGSTKVGITKAAGGLNFIGSHPLAGSEQSGIDNAKAKLFSGSTCIITITGKENKASILQIRKLWEKLGAKTTFLTPEKHDRILSFTSHLPHVTAFALIKTIPKDYIKFSAGGLKDTTRIALSNPDLWADIFISNRSNTLSAIESMEKSLCGFKNALVKNDKKALISFLKSAQKKRKSA